MATTTNGKLKKTPKLTYKPVLKLPPLPEDQRQVVVLHVWGEFTFSQTAEVLGISSNTAASRYRYALANLRELMLPKEDSYANPSR